MPRLTSAEWAQHTFVRDVVRAQPEPVCLLGNRNRSRGATDTGKRKGKTASRDRDCPKVKGAIDPGSTVHSTAERKSSLDLNDGRDAFGWVRSVHGEYTSIQQGLTVDCRVDPEGVYLNASQLGGNQFAIWPDEHDAENETNWVRRGLEARVIAISRKNLGSSWWTWRWEKQDREERKSFLEVCGRLRGDFLKSKCAIFECTMIFDDYTMYYSSEPTLGYMKMN